MRLDVAQDSHAKFTQVIHFVVTYCFQWIEVLKRHWCEPDSFKHFVGLSIVDCFIYAISMYSKIVKDAKHHT